MSRPRALLAALPAACAALLMSCGDGRPKAPTNVILVVLDTVRSDHLSCYGYARRTTPNLDAFAAGADRYTTARASAPWTLPSHASLFTGRFPFQHHAEAYERRDTETGNIVIEDAAALAPAEITLAEVLRDERYRTGAIVANMGYVNERSGLDQGFEHFENERVDAVPLTNAALAWLDSAQAPQPFFLFMNYMDAHRTYRAAPLIDARRNEVPGVPPPGETGDTYLDALYVELFDKRGAASPDLVTKAIDTYDNALANLDIGLGLLFEQLKRRGLYDDALIIVCADHGEYFGEHNLVEHSKDVYEPVLRIPLIIKRPGQTSGRIVDTPVSIADVPRLAFAALPTTIEDKHAAQFPGSARLPLFAELSFSRKKDLQRWQERFDRTRSAMYLEHYKVIRSSDGKHELYDLAADPREEHDLFASKPLEARVLLEQLQRTQQRHGGAASPTPLSEPTEAELKVLRELGYTESAPKER